MTLDSKLKKWLETTFSERVKFDEPMAKHTSLRVGGPTDAFVMVENKEELSELVRKALESDTKWLVIGAGTNLLVSDSGIQGIVVVLTKSLEELSTPDEDENTFLFKASAGLKIQTFCRLAAEKGARGMNFAIGIPGTVGGAIAMNAGTSLGSMEDVIETVTFLHPEKGIVELEKDELDFRYRELAIRHPIEDATDSLPIILEGGFRLAKGDPRTIKQEADQLLKKRWKNQPVSLPNAGCFFKNPSSTKPAGRLIDLAGLKGFQVGGAKISEKHANFFVNTGNASANDFLTLMETVRTTVFERFNIKLESEVKIAG